MLIVILTDFIGECLHEWVGTDGDSTWHQCVNCGLEQRFYDCEGPPEINNFFSPIGYDKLRNAHDKWEPIEKAMFYMHLKLNIPQTGGFVIGEKVFQRDCFANWIYDFIRRRAK